MFHGRGEQTQGGHWRFTDADVLYVAATKVIGTLGLELPVATKVAELCLPEVADSIRGRLPIGHEATHPFVFIWNISDTCPELLADVGGVSAIGGTEFCVYRLRDLNRIPAFSKAGGYILIPSDLGRKIPAAVADLFRETSA